jgi:hypothetical protein
MKRVLFAVSAGAAIAMVAAVTPSGSGASTSEISRVRFSARVNTIAFPEVQRRGRSYYVGVQVKKQRGAIRHFCIDFEDDNNSWLVRMPKLRAYDDDVFCVGTLGAAVRKRTFVARLVAAKSGSHTLKVGIGSAKIFRVVNDAIPDSTTITSPGCASNPFSPPDAARSDQTLRFRVRATVESHSPGGGSLASDWRAEPARALRTDRMTTVEGVSEPERRLPPQAEVIAGPTEPFLGVPVGVILAAGSGSRLGRLPKPLVRVAGVTLLERALATFHGAGLGPPGLPGARQRDRGGLPSGGR